MFPAIKRELSQLKQSPLFFPFIIFLSALLLRLIYILQTQKSPLGNYLVVDSKFYHAWALRVWAGEWAGSEIFPMSPLYPYWLATIFTLFSKNLFVVKIIQAVPGSLSCVLLFSLTKNITGDRRTGVLAGLMAAAYGPFIFYDAMVMKTFLAVFLTLLSAWILSIPESKKLHSFSAGVCLALSVLVRENILLLIPFIFIWLFFSSGKSGTRRGGTLAGAFLLGIVIVIAPLTARNLAISGELVLVTAVGGENFYLGNNAGTDGYYRPPHFIAPNPAMEHENWRERASEILGREVTAMESSDFWFSRGVEFILNEPVKFLKLLFNKLKIFWNFYEAPDNYNYYFWQNLSPLLKSFTIHFGVVAPLALLGLIISVKRSAAFTLPYMFFFGYLGSFLIFFNLARYRLPVIPFTILFAAYGANWLMVKIRLRKYNKLLFAAPITTLFFILCNIPAKGVSHFADDCDECYARLGAAYASKKRYDKAEEAYRTAIRLNPDFAINRNGLGMVYLYQQKLHLAENEFRNAILIKPKLGEAHYNLGTTLMAQNRMDKAIRSFRLALQHSFVPDFLASIHNNLGNAYAKTGHITSAIEEYKKALKINPNHKNSTRNLNLLLQKKNPQEI